MDNCSENRVAWFDALTKRFSSSRLKVQGKAQFADPYGRTVLVAKARWIFLILTGLFAACVGGFFFLSRFGFFLSAWQLFFLCASVAGVAAYNCAYHFFYQKISRIPLVDHCQVFLDIIFVTIIIHFSGGAASWFWPVYLIVTIEAAFLLEKERDVWLLGALGGLAYGTLLAAEYSGLLPHLLMPFTASDLTFDCSFLTLSWLWTALLNTVTAVILTFLMSVIRRETRLLRESEERHVDFVEAANDLICSSTPDGRILYANRSWRRVMGYAGDELGGIQLWDLIPASNRSRFMEQFAQLMAGNSVSLLETIFITRDGGEVVLEGNLTLGLKDGDPSVVWGSFRDVTERIAAQKQLHKLAHYDVLTSLPNRTLLLERLRSAKAHAKRNKDRTALLFLDLDRFKIINDTLGHPVGDQLLVSVASRLSSCCREIDTVSRIGGDEFIIILEGIKNSAEAEAFARKVMQRLSEPHVVGEHELFVTGSIGISMYPDDDDDLDNLIKKADIAMYAAKGQGNNNFRCYDVKMDEHAHKRFVMENSMRRAMEEENFLLYYQPKLDIISGEIIALEALLRWQHPDLGLVSPADFIPIAEETGLIVPLGEWVLMQACAQNKAWQDQGVCHLRVAVNLSGYQLQQANFLEVVKRILSTTGLEPRYLELEITETVVMQNPDFTVVLLAQLGEMGIHISIDDFGTGYSSLSHLKRFSVNTLKMDKSFMRGVTVNDSDGAIATAIISMGRSLNLRVIAEGVETEEQYAFLRQTQCDEVQGFLFSKPIPPEEVLRYLKANGVVPVP